MKNKLKTRVNIVEAGEVFFETVPDENGNGDKEKSFKFARNHIFMKPILNHRGTSFLYNSYSAPKAFSKIFSSNSRTYKSQPTKTRAAKMVALIDPNISPNPRHMLPMPTYKGLREKVYGPVFSSSGWGFPSAITRILRVWKRDTA